MISRRQWQLAALTTASALFLAACGGGSGISGAVDAPVAKRVIVFGDSLSDLGTYTPATQIPLGQAPGVPPFFGGRFTTNTFTGYSATSNTSTAVLWAEWVASRVGVSITPAEVGFVTTRVPCPAAATPALAGSCTGYAQGGARVTDPNGIGKSGGALTIPLVAQIASQNTRTVPSGFKTGFDSGDIVFVWGGNNDALVQFTAVGGGLAPATAVANMQTAATELVALVKDQILAKGATRVAGLTLGDLALTPAFAALPAPNKAVLSQLTAEFNATLTTGLAGTAARIIDTRPVFADFAATPAKYGFTNVTTTACDPAKVSAVTGGRVTDGSSLFCNGSPASAFVAPVPNLNTLRTGASTSTWLFADSVHPTPGAHKVFSDIVIDRIKGFGWIPANL